MYLGTFGKNMFFRVISRFSQRPDVWFRRVGRGIAGFGGWTGRLPDLGLFCNRPKFFLSPRFPEVDGKGGAGRGFMSFGVGVRHRHLGRHPGCILQRGRAKGGLGGAWKMWLSVFECWCNKYFRNLSPGKIANPQKGVPSATARPQNNGSGLKRTKTKTMYPFVR